MRTVMMKKENRIGVDAMQQVRDIVPVDRIRNLAFGLLYFYFCWKVSILGLLYQTFWW